MELAIVNKLLNNRVKNRNIVTSRKQNLAHGEINHPYTIKGIDTLDREMMDFLFSLGCFEGEKITVISILAENYIIHIKGARYSIDANLAKAILI